MSSVRQGARPVSLSGSRTGLATHISFVRRSGFAQMLVWKFIMGGAPQFCEFSPIAVLRLRKDLWAWYEEYHASHDDTLTKLAELVPTMLGSERKPALKTKACETWGLVLFLRATCDKYSGALGSELARLKSAAQCLIDYMAVLKNSGAALAERSLQDFDLGQVHVGVFIGDP